MGLGFVKVTESGSPKSDKTFVATLQIQGWRLQIYWSLTQEQKILFLANNRTHCLLDCKQFHNFIFDALAYFKTQVKSSALS